MMATGPAKIPTSNDLAQQRTSLAYDRTNLADQRTSLALDRTRLAHERTLMAWVRTAVSLISFGFTIYKFFEYLRESELVVPARRLLTPRDFALVMISLGLGVLVLASTEYRQQMKALQKRYPQYGPFPLSLATT